MQGGCAHGLTEWARLDGTGLHGDGITDALVDSGIMLPCAVAPHLQSAMNNRNHCKGLGAVRDM